MRNKKALGEIRCRFEAIKNATTDLLNEIYSQRHAVFTLTVKLKLDPIIFTRISAIASEYELTLSM